MPEFHKRIAYIHRNHSLVHRINLKHPLQHSNTRFGLKRLLRVQTRNGTRYIAGATLSASSSSPPSPSSSLLERASAGSPPCLQFCLAVSLCKLAASSSFLGRLELTCSGIECTEMDRDVQRRRWRTFRISSIPAGPICMQVKIDQNSVTGAILLFREKKKKANSNPPVTPFRASGTSGREMTFRGLIED